LLEGARDLERFIRDLVPPGRLTHFVRYGDAQGELADIGADVRGVHPEKLCEFKHRLHAHRHVATKELAEGGLAHAGALGGHLLRDSGIAPPVLGPERAHALGGAPVGAGEHTLTLGHISAAYIRAY
jgi:hypothetical protein